MRKGKYLILTTEERQPLYLRINAIASVKACRNGAVVSTGPTSFYVVIEQPETIFEAMTNQEVD